jgi:rhodanese-related sulfurtransferase
MGQATSTRVVRQLQEQGFRSAFFLHGGFDAWMREDGLVEPKGSG